MGVEQKQGQPQPSRRDLVPLEGLMDDFGLPRKTKYDFEQGMIDGMTNEEAAKLLEYSVERGNTLPRGPLKRPRVSWDTVQDAIYIEFQAGSEYIESHRQALGSRTFFDADTAGNIVGVLLRDVSQGVSVQGLPNQRGISRMLRRRDIQVIRPPKSR